MKRFNSENSEAAVAATLHALERLIDTSGELGALIEATPAKELPAFVMARLLLDAGEYFNRLRGHLECLQHGKGASRGGT